MAKIMPKRAYEKDIFDGFHGVFAKPLLGGKGAVDMRNFRILSDGSLEKRCGWRTMLSFSEDVRGFWQGTVGELSLCFVVAGTQVYRVSGATPTAITTLSGMVGRVRFFVYRDELFLADGTSLLIYRKSADRFEQPQGYAPLYGYNWHPTNMGNCNEPLNLLSGRLRVHYLNTTGSTLFKLPYYADTVDQVRVDGLVTSDFSLLDSEKTVSIPSASTGASVEIAFSITLFEELRDAALQATCAFVHYGEAMERLLLYGAPKGNLLFCSANVDEDMLNASTAVWSDSDPLYFTYNTVLSLGDVTRPITSLFYNHGRILAFHREGAYALYLSEDSDTVEFYPILQGMGCSARDTTLYLETDPVVVNRGGVFRLHSMASAPDLFEITCLSEGIDALCGDEFATEAVVCEDTLHGELWFCNPQEKLVWVYRTASEEWTVFDNLSPVFFFRVGTDVGFATPCAVCLFDELLSTDNGLPINAFYRTGYLSFGYPELPKRSFRISLAAHTGGNRFDLEIDGESGHRDFSIQGTPKSFPELLDRRLTLGRSRLMQVTLRDSGSERSRIYRLALYANL